MNLNAYDSIENNTKNEISITYKRLYSKTIKHLKYYTLAKRYNNNSKQYIYYIIVSNTITDDRTWHSLLSCKYGVKIDLTPIWNNIYNKVINDNNVIINKIEEDEDTIVYHLDV